MALTELKYRTFDEVLDSVKIDMYTWDLENLLNPQQLIKVAMRVNYDLGLKINKQKSRVIEIIDGKGKLPNNFDVLNYALVCEDNTFYDMPSTIESFDKGVSQGVAVAQMFLNSGNARDFAIVIDIAPGSNPVVHNMNTANVIVQAITPEGNVIDADINLLDFNTVEIVSKVTQVVEDVRVTVIGVVKAAPGDPTCPAVVTCPPNGTPHVYYTTNTGYNWSRRLIPLHMITHARSTSYEKTHTLGTKSHPHHHDRSGNRHHAGIYHDLDPYYNHYYNYPHYYDAYLKNGYLHVAFAEGKVYVNYQSTMEDDAGNLLTLDNPYTNEYYEYAIKQRIFENLFMSGEQVQNHLQLMSQKLREARNVALGFVNTPDFEEMRKLFEVNRKAAMHLYYNMFKNNTY